MKRELKIVKDLVLGVNEEAVQKYRGDPAVVSHSKAIYYNNLIVPHNIRNLA